MNINWPRAVARRILSLSLAPFLTVFCAIFCASLISMPAAAQDTQATQSAPIDTKDIVARPIPQRTVGLEPGKIVKWTLRDAILAAYEKNVDIELEKENVRMMQYDLISFQGFYDPTMTSSIFYTKSTRATAQRDQGLVGNDNTLSNRQLTYNFGANKNMERWGGLFQADFFNTRASSNQSALTTEYRPSMQFQFTQPLFRNFAIDNARRQIKVTKKRLDLTDAQFRAKLIDIILQVQQAYWNLSLAIKNEGVQRDSVKLAETFLNNVKRQVDVGTQAPIEAVSAAADLESRRIAVFQAMNQVGQAENALKNLTASGPNDELWSSVIEPIESFDIKQPVNIPVPDAIKLAHENRPEIRQASLSKEINKIQIDFARNQAKPQINLFATYRTDGLGGSAASINTSNCSPLIGVRGPDGQQLPPVCGTLGLRQDAPGVFTPVAFDLKTPVFTSQPPIADQFVGGYGTALGNMFKNQFRTLTFGVDISLPLRNRQAKAQLGKALEADRQLDLQTRVLMQNIEVEVRNAVQSVEMAKMRIDAAEAATKYARQQLEGEQKKFEAGLQAVFFVLQRQNQLSVALVSELQAKADYNIAVANLHRVMSTTLSNNSIEVKQEAPVTIR
jgi:HAE1 family hydrophobic/amphiphilic exporter-1